MKTNDQSVIRKQIREYLIEHRVNQTQLARKAGLSGATMSRILRGDTINLRHIKGIARATGKDIVLTITHKEEEC